MLWIEICRWSRTVSKGPIFAVWRTCSVEYGTMHNTFTTVSLNNDLFSYDLRLWLVKFITTHYNLALYCLLLASRELQTPVMRHYWRIHMPMRPPDPFHGEQTAVVSPSSNRWSHCVAQERLPSLSALTTISYELTCLSCLINKARRTSFSFNTVEEKTKYLIFW